jgi:hypothetical protein
MIFTCHTPEAEGQVLDFIILLLGTYSLGSDLIDAACTIHGVPKILSTRID